MATNTISPTAKDAAWFAANFRPDTGVCAPSESAVVQGTTATSYAIYRLHSQVTPGIASSSDGDGKYAYSYVAEFYGPNGVLTQDLTFALASQPTVYSITNATSAELAIGDYWANDSCYPVATVTITYDTVAKTLKLHVVPGSASDTLLRTPVYVIASTSQRSAGTLTFSATGLATNSKTLSTIFVPAS